MFIIMLLCVNMELKVNGMSCCNMVSYEPVEKSSVLSEK